MDGTIEGHTGFLLKPYEDRKGYRGKPVWELENFKETALELRKQGFQIHVHSISDGQPGTPLTGWSMPEAKSCGTPWPTLNWWTPLT